MNMPDRMYATLDNFRSWSFTPYDQSVEYTLSSVAKAREEELVKALTKAREFIFLEMGTTSMDSLIHNALNPPRHEALGDGQ